MGKFNNLPKEIVFDILTRVPTESMLECKLVCKPWRDFVCQPSFSRLHTNYHHSAAEDSGFLFYSHQPSQIEKIDISGKSFLNVLSSKDEFFFSKTPFNRKIRIDLSLPFKNYSLAGSCNGLICFTSWHTTGCGPVYICNPVTREYITLPDIDGYYYGNGFGYCPSTNEYKVVRIRKYEESQVVQVYTLGSGNVWTTVCNINNNVSFTTLCAGAFANGALHWEDHESGSIFAYYLADEKCSEIPYPPGSTQAYTRYLGVLGGFLSVTSYRDANACEIWFRKRNKDNGEWCWSKEFSIESHIPLPFGLTKNGMLLCYEEYQLFGYDLKASSVKMEVSFGKPITEAISHKNTLVSLKVLGGNKKTTECSESPSEAMERLALEASI